MATEQEIGFIRDNLNFIFGLFVVFEELRQRTDINDSFRKILVSGLARSYIGGLAALTDPVKDSLGNENLSIHLVPDIDLSEHHIVIGKLRNIRNKIIAHNDKEAMLKGEDFLKEINFTIPESEALLLKLVKIIEDISNTSMPTSRMKGEYIDSLNKFIPKSI